MKISDDLLFYIRGAHEHAEVWRNPTPDQLDAILTALVLAVTLIQCEPDGRAAYERVRRAIAERHSAALRDVERRRG